MRLSKLVCTKSFKGLKPIKLDEKPLGKVIALVGKNGAGKSRILELVEQLISIDPLCLENNTFTDYVINKNSDVSHIEGKTDSILVKSLKEISLKNTDLLKRIIPIYIKRIDNDILKILSKDTSLNFESIINNPNSINEIQHLNSSSCLNYIQELARKLEIESYNYYQENKDIKTTPIYNDFNNIISFVNLFLNKQIGYNRNLNKTTGVINVTLTLDKQKFEFEHLSPGERALFAYGILSYLIDKNKNISLKDSIIIVDEPEKSLHPEAQILFINKLREIVNGGTGQLWIATHSISIISQLDINEVFLVKENEIFKPSHKNPGLTIEKLFGKDNSFTEKLYDFIISIDEWDFANFTYECLNEPESIESITPDDPQIEAFIRTLKEQQNIDLLDFGAGKGRVGKLINDTELKRRIKYSALEIDIDKTDFIRENVKNIKDIYPDCALIPYHSQDIVLLCNVLHEISPTEWVYNLNHIKRILKGNGRLVIIEDLLLSKGELPNDYGFFLLTIEQLKILFNTENVSAFNSTKASYNNRILCSVIEKKDINVNDESVFNSLHSLKKTSLNQIKILRKDKTIEKRGKKLALFTQMVSNCEISHDDLHNFPYFIKDIKSKDFYIKLNKIYYKIPDIETLVCLNFNINDAITIDISKNPKTFKNKLTSIKKGLIIRTDNAYYIELDNMLHWIPNPETLKIIKTDLKLEELIVDNKYYTEKIKGFQIKDFSKQ